MVLIVSVGIAVLFLAWAFCLAVIACPPLAILFKLKELPARGGGDELQSRPDNEENGS